MKATELMQILGKIVVEQGDLEVAALKGKKSGKNLTSREYFWWGLNEFGVKVEGGILRIGYNEDY